MKKQSIILGALLVMASGLQAASLAEVVAQITNAANQFGVNALNKNVPTAEQNASLNKWNDALAMAKTFVMDNSKNLIGSKDSDITQAMAAVDKASMDFINVIKISRGLRSATDLGIKVGDLSTIKKDLINSTNQLGLKNMTLSNKKNAKDVVISIGRFLEKMIDTIQNIIREMAQTASQPTPPTRTL